MRIFSVLVFAFLLSLPVFAFASESVITVKYGDESFEVPVSLTSGDVKSITVDPNFKSIILQLDEASDNILITLPRSLIDAKNGDMDDDFIIIVDNIEMTPYEIKTTDTQREIKITIPENTKSVEIIGTNIVPEFPFVLLVLVASITTIIVITKTQSNQS